MTSVRDAAFELFRDRGMTTIFGNPGSTELPMLAPLPGGLPLRARPAGGRRRRDGRRLRAGERLGHARQPAHRARASATPSGRSSTPRRTRRRCSSPPASRSARSSRCRRTSPTATPSRCPSRSSSGATSRRAPPTCRSRSRRRSTTRRCRRPDRRSSRSRWTTGCEEIEPVDYSTADRAHGRPGARCPTRRRSAALAARLRGGAQPRLRRRPRHRRLRRLGRGHRAGREPAPAGVGLPRHRRQPHRLPREPPRLPGRSCRRRSGRSA